MIKAASWDALRSMSASTPLSEDLYKTIGKVEARKAADMARQKARWRAENNFNASRHQANKDVMHEADQPTWA